jgi:hypothetical protein
MYFSTGDKFRSSLTGYRYSITAYSDTKEYELTDCNSTTVPGCFSETFLVTELKLLNIVPDNMSAAMHCMTIPELRGIDWIQYPSIVPVWWEQVTSADTTPVTPRCIHRWVESLGLARLYRDCATCKAKYEDTPAAEGGGLQS